MIDYAVCAALLTGTSFIALSAIGILRLPDVYSRLHAITKASTLGIAGVLAASALHFAMRGDNVIGELVAMYFVLLTNPVGGHMIARSAYLIGIPMTEQSVVDQLDRAGAHAPARHDTD